MNKKTPVLVLGANGFIGSHLVDSLVSAGFRVRAFDRFTSSTTHLFADSDRVEIVSGDFLNHEDVSNALDNVDSVFHLVSTTTPASAENDPLIDVDTNLRGSIELFKMCAEKGVKRIMFTSSGGTVYGNRKDCVPITEDDPTLPVSPYGIAKLAAENYLRYFKAKYGVEYMVFRLSNPYGERQPFWRRQGVIAVFLDRIMKDEPIEILGDGTMVRDYIYVKDAANMMVRAFMSNPKHEIYNIGSGDGVSVNDIAKIIEKVTSTSAARQYEAMPPTFVHTSVLNIDRYVKEFSFGPEITIHEGIKKACKYYAIMQR